MIFKCPKGMFILQKNFRDAFNLEAFMEKYFEEVFDNDLYIVGDISSGILRLKGFDSNPNSPKHFSLIDKYFETAVVIGSPFYVLKRIRNEQEYEKVSKDDRLSRTDESGFVIHTLEKVSFDKESLVLESVPDTHKHVEIDMKKVNEMPKGSLPQDLKELASTSREKDDKPQIYTLPKTEIIPESTQTYVSASPDFDPSKKKDFGKKNNFNKPNFNQNKNNNQKRDQKPNNGNNNQKPNNNQNQNKPNNGNNNQNKPNNNGNNQNGNFKKKHKHNKKPNEA